MLGQPAVEFIPLAICNWERFGVLTNALPKVINESQALLDRQIQEILR